MVGARRRWCARVWFERGVRPEGAIDRRHASAWLYAALRPGTDEAFAPILTEVGAAAMQASLDRFAAAAVPEGVHAALPLDGAGWRPAGGIAVPANVGLVFPPPYGPQPNPVERAWLLLRERSLSLRLFAGLDEIFDGCRDAWSRLVEEPGRIASLTDYPYLGSLHDPCKTER
jgi:putative transposase